MKKYLMEKTAELASLTSIPESSFYKDSNLAEMARYYAQYGLSLSPGKGGVMAAKKKQILVVDFDERQCIIDLTKEDAESYINKGLDMGASLDDFEVYEVTKKLCLEESTKVVIADDC